jgi:hypothetical protein
MKGTSEQTNLTDKKEEEKTMKNMKKILVAGAIIMAIGATSAVAFAASIYKSPAEAAAGLTGKTVEQIIEERQETGKTYGTIAKDAGKLEEFIDENLQIKKDALEKRVADKTMTREQADAIIKALEENSANCDGTGSAKIGQKFGAGFGSGSGNGARDGSGMRNGGGQGKGKGGGMGRGQGTCVAQ